MKPPPGQKATGIYFKATSSEDSRALVFLFLSRSLASIKPRGGARAFSHRVPVRDCGTLSRKHILSAGNHRYADATHERTRGAERMRARYDVAFSSARVSTNERGKRNRSDFPFFDDDGRSSSSNEDYA